MRGLLTVPVENPVEKHLPPWGFPRESEQISGLHYRGAGASRQSQIILAK
jgi:hypothetical protein